ncbi:hypothetical protein FH972_011291 [Carpinus fangiana]|uniref:Uncharacterized protein n=1 Tax=Carpinus fangiana TaxID=176857 RepID=A0A660KWZ2_9ROSI|nr:hypothetical protein FH972_011291 [Carpinus fangiana]
MSRMKKIISESDNDDEFYIRKLKKNEQSSSSASVRSLVKEDMEPVQCRKLDNALFSNGMTTKLVHVEGRSYLGCINSFTI